MRIDNHIVSKLQTSTILVNEDICDNFLTTTQADFEASESGLWVHLFESETGEDLLLIKGKSIDNTVPTIESQQECVNNALDLVQGLSNPPSAYGFDNENKGEQLLYIVHQLLLESLFLEDCPINVGDVDDTNPILYKECKPKEYRFKTQGKLFKSGAKIWFCPTSLPDTIWVTDLNGNPITYPISWENATPILADTINYAAIIDSSNYLSGGAVATFNVEGEKKATTLRLNNKGNASFELINNGSSTYAYDDNQIMDYPSYKTTPKDGIPWKFLETNTTESMEAKLDKYPSALMQTSDPELTITPNSMNSKSQMVQLQHAATLSGATKEIDVMGCHDIPELKVFVGDAIHKTVNFVYLCDSLGNCPNNIDADIPLLVKEANDVLNKAGLYITQGNIIRDTLTTLSVFLSDNIISQSEQENLHRRKYLGSHFFSSDYLVMIVPDLGGTTLGRATLSAPNDPPPNSLAIEANNPTGATLAHEIGHAAFKFAHPGDPKNPHHNPVCDIKNFMFFTAKNPTNSPFPCKGTRVNNIRAFQFKIIHQIR